MPIIQIHLIEGRPVEKKRKLVESVTESVCRVLGVPEDQVRIILSEMAPEHYAVGGVLKHDTR